MSLVEEVEEANTRPSTAKTIPEIDFVGNGSFQVSQMNLLQKRSVEPFKDTSAKLSARGLHHRSSDQFVKEAQNASNIILGELRNGKRLGGKSNKPAAYLFTPYFQRALAYERLNDVDRAIADYTMCINIESKFAPAYFNRGGLYRMKGRMEEAIADLDMAVNLDPANGTYRTNRSLLFRQKGQYIEAIQDTMICRALQIQPHIVADLQAHKEVALNSESLLGLEPDEDPILKVLSLPSEERLRANLDPVVDFLKTLKFFAPFASNRPLLNSIAGKVTLHHYRRDEKIFDEGEPGFHYFMILDGEISIVKLVLDANGGYADTITLVKLFRGHSFGETALEGRGVRTAGAIATQTSNVIALHATDYQEIMRSYKDVLRDEVRNILICNPVFSDWEVDRLDHLATFAVLKSFSPNFEIMSEGSPMKHLYIIKRGMVKLIKSLEKPQLSNMVMSETESERSFETPGLWVLDKNWRDRLEMFENSDKRGQCEFTVGVLGSGQVFGELAVLDPTKKAPSSAVSFTAVEVYCIEGDILIALGARFNASCMNALNESLNLHNPPIEKINYYFRSKYAWESRKSKLLQNIKRQNGLPHIDESRKNNSHGTSKNGMSSSIFPG